jgi:hypothetical protein
MDPQPDGRLRRAAMFAEDQGPAEAVIGFTDQFVQAGVARLDALFGAGYAKENPQALAAYVAACASNLETLMNAAMAAQEDESFGEALAAFESEFVQETTPKPKGRRR